MTAIRFRAPRRLAVGALVAVGALALLGERAGAQTVGGTAYGSYVNVLGVTTQSPIATLPSTGGMAVGDARTFNVTDALDAQWLKAVTTGAVDDPTSTSQSTSEVESVSVLGGLITADIVTAVTSSYRNASGAASNTEGSGFVNLVVNGLAISTDVAPNTRVDLPGVGYVVLNELVPSGDGVTTSGITVNMIHVVLEETVVDLLGNATTVQTGEIIVGSASSRVDS